MCKTDGNATFPERGFPAPDLERKTIDGRCLRKMMHFGVPESARIGQNRPPVVRRDQRRPDLATFRYSTAWIELTRGIEPVNLTEVSPTQPGASVKLNREGALRGAPS